MTALPAVLLLSCLSGVAVVAWLRPRTRPRWPEDLIPQDRETAMVQARDLVHLLTGTAVTGWHASAAVWGDPRAVRQAGAAGAADSWLVAAGLVSSWRVRFVGTDSTIAIGVGPHGEVVNLDCAGGVFERRRLVQAPVPADLDDVATQGRLDGRAPEGVWRRATRAGALAAADAPDRSTPLVADVRAHGSQIVHVRLGSGDRSTRAQPVFLRSQEAAVLAPVIAVVLGVIKLIQLRTAPAAVEAVAAAAVFFAAASWIMPQMLDGAVVHDYNARETWRRFRRRFVRQALLANLISAATVLLGVAIGLPLLRLAGGTSAAAPVQVAIGACAGTVLLALVLAGYAAAAPRYVTLAPELWGPALARAGQSWRHVMSVSTQSATAEETWCRLLLTAAVWLWTGSAVAGILTSAAVWVAMHDRGGVSPQWVRTLELTLLGVAYGVLLVTTGTLTAIVAHATFNVLLLGWPLASRGAGPRGGEDDRHGQDGPADGERHDHGPDEALPVGTRNHRRRL